MQDFELKASQFIFDSNFKREFIHRTRAITPCLIKFISVTGGQKASQRAVGVLF